MADNRYDPSYDNFLSGEESYWIDRHTYLHNVSENSGAKGSKGWNTGWGEQFVANLVEGGQLGYGFKAGVFDAATPLAFPPATIVVLQTPMMWDVTDNASGSGNGSLGDGGILAMTVKSMFECHAKSVTGIDVNYTLDSGDQPIGHDGQNFKVPTQSKRTEVNPSFTWPEVTGNLVWNIILRWIWDIQDPDTNAGLEFMGDNPLPYTMSAYSLTFMAIQFDQTMHPDRIIDAAIYCNVYPQATGEMGMQRTIGTTEVKERNVTFNAYLMHNKYTKYLGRELAYQLNLRSETYQVANPNTEQVDAQFGDGELDGNGWDAGIGIDRHVATTSGDVWAVRGPNVRSDGFQTAGPSTRV